MEEVENVEELNIMCWLSNTLFFPRDMDSSLRGRRSGGKKETRDEKWLKESVCNTERKECCPVCHFQVAFFFVELT